MYTCNCFIVVPTYLRSLFGTCPWPSHWRRSLTSEKSCGSASKLASHMDWGFSVEIAKAVWAVALSRMDVA